MIQEPLLAPVRPAFRALAGTIVPAAASLDEGQWEELEAIVEDYLSRRPQQLRRQLRLFVRALQVMPLALYWRPFTGLDAEQRTRFLSCVEDSRVLLIRRGFWGLRTMVYLGYYSRSAAPAEIGYRAHVRGWEARR